MAEKKFFPMMPETSWWALRQQFKKTIPATVSISYLKSLLGLTSDQSARNILSPLKQMKIIDEEGKPLPRANDWRNDDKYPQVCKEILLEVYPSDLLDLFPDDDIDTAVAKNWFMDVCALGASGASKTAATFSLLKSGKIKDMSEKNVVKKTKNSSPVKSEAVKKQNISVEKMTLQENSGYQPENKDMPANKIIPTVHIDLQIHISPEASTEQIDTIFASIAKHLYVRG